MRRDKTSITRRSKLLCPNGGCGLKRVTFIDPKSYQGGPTLVRLECGHERGEILPAKGVSLEHMGTNEGAFRAVHDLWVPNWRIAA
jgi:hypothetical protein